MPEFPSDDAPIQRIPRVRWAGSEATPGDDLVVQEEPLEIRVAGIPLAVLMRTPGHDLDLGRGFLLTEGIVPSLAAIAQIRHCSTATTPEAEDNVLLVVPTSPIGDWQRHQRNLYSSSSCGTCGKATIERAMLHAAPLPPDELQLDIHVLHQLPGRLHQSQAVFAATGGVHAAGLFDLTGNALVVREDIGRHNAVDKVVGAVALERPEVLARSVLMVSGRISFEIAQKALAVRIPIVAGVSAASSLAVGLAQASGLTLAAFVRNGSCSVYSGGQRLRG